MASKTFVSFNFNNRERVGSMRAFFQQHQRQIQGTSVFCENDVSAQGPATIDAEILRVMKGCDAALFVIGNEDHNSPWIRREAQLAQNIPLRIVVVRLDGPTGAEPPELSAAANVTRVGWNVREIADALNKVGKTK